MAYHKTPTSVQVGKEVKQYLKEAGISTGRAAEMLNVSPGFVSMHLSGRPFTAAQAKKWAETFGLDETFLLTGTRKRDTMLALSQRAKILQELERLKEEDAVCLVIGDRVVKLDGVRASDLVDVSPKSYVKQMVSPGRRNYSPAGRRRITPDIFEITKLNGFPNLTKGKIR